MQNPKGTNLVVAVLFAATILSAGEGQAQVVLGEHSRFSIEVRSLFFSPFSHAAEDEFERNNNFYEATGGRATIHMDGLSKFQRHSATKQRWNTGLSSTTHNILRMQLAAATQHLVGEDRPRDLKNAPPFQAPDRAAFSLSLSR